MEGEDEAVKGSTWFYVLEGLWQEARAILAAVLRTLGFRNQGDGSPE